MIWIDDKKQAVPYDCFENLNNTGLVVNAFTSKKYYKDGLENNFFQPLLRKNSNPDEVDLCLKMIREQFHVDPLKLITSAQKHTINIHEISEKDLGPMDTRPKLSEIDGLITNKSNVMLQTFGADCPSVYLLDPVNKAIGLCHSGRKGTQNHIAVHMLNAMTAAYGTKPADVLAAISPGICVDCYEVGMDVAEEFRSDYLSLCPDATAVSTLLPEYNNIPHIDLFEAIKLSLTSFGVKQENIEVSHECTKCNCEKYYSFRAEGGISNENSALFMLK